MIINEIKEYLAENDLSKIDKLDECTKINDIQEFIDTHISYLEFNKGNKTFKPYYNRLYKLIRLDMIRKQLEKGAKTFDELLTNLSKSHHKKSLEIELQTLLDIGKVIFDNGKYKLKK